MIDQGVVVQRVDKRGVWVRRVDDGGCQSCSQSCSVAFTAGLIKRKESDVALFIDRPNYKPGDLLSLKIQESYLVHASLLAYVVPLSALLLGALLGECLAEFVFLIDREWPSIVGGLSFFMGSLLYLRWRSLRDDPFTDLTVSRRSS